MNPDNAPEEVKNSPVRQEEGLTFGQALGHLKHNGLNLARAGWNGKGMYIYLRGEEFRLNTKYLAHIMMKTAQGDRIPWLASQTDLLAEDWAIV